MPPESVSAILHLRLEAAKITPVLIAEKLRDMRANARLQALVATDPVDQIVHRGSPEIDRNGVASGYLADQQLEQKVACDIPAGVIEGGVFDHDEASPNSALAARDVGAS